MTQNDSVMLLRCRVFIVGIRRLQRNERHCRGMILGCFIETKQHENGPLNSLNSVFY